MGSREQGVKRTAILSYLRLGVLLHGRTVVSGKSRYVTGLEVGARCLGCHLVPSTKACKIITNSSSCSYSDDFGTQCLPFSMKKLQGMIQSWMSAKRSYQTSLEPLNYHGAWFLDGDADLPEILRPLAAFDWGAGRRGI
ncbi:hypothetical protein V6N11_078866 [Hibiscus sabdariffa]|uniref:Uncharacterized protein n=1 Tax=Hibiscus sabdariffa TaxID=183260 RepID=A0ABR2RTR2_9ROSI